MNTLSKSFSEFIAPLITPLILIATVVGFVCLVLAAKCSKTTLKDIDKYSEKKFKKNQFRLIAVPYTIFNAVVSILPLLGMLGTVTALVNIDLSGELDSVRGDFFIALDTTMWGLVSSIILKTLNAPVQPDIERAEEKLLDLMKQTYF